MISYDCSSTLFTLRMYQTMRPYLETQVPVAMRRRRSCPLIVAHFRLRQLLTIRTHVAFDRTSPMTSQNSEF